MLGVDLRVGTRRRERNFRRSRGSQDRPVRRGCHVCLGGLRPRRRGRETACRELASTTRPLTVSLRHADRHLAQDPHLPAVKVPKRSGRLDRAAGVRPRRSCGSTLAPEDATGHPASARLHDGGRGGGLRKRAGDVPTSSAGALPPVRELDSDFSTVREESFSSHHNALGTVPVREVPKNRPRSPRWSVRDVTGQRPRSPVMTTRSGNSSALSRVCVRQVTTRCPRSHDQQAPRTGTGHEHRPNLHVISRTTGLKSSGDRGRDGAEARENADAQKWVVRSRTPVRPSSATMRGGRGGCRDIADIPPAVVDRRRPDRMLSQRAPGRAGAYDEVGPLRRPWRGH